MESVVDFFQDVVSEELYDLVHNLTDHAIKWIDFVYFLGCISVHSIKGRFQPNARIARNARFLRII